VHKEADYAVQIIKAVDVVHNCSTLGDSLPEEMIKNKIENCKALYLDISKKICPEFHKMVLLHLKPLTKPNQAH